MKNLFYLTLTVVSIMTISNCGGGSNSADQERIAQLEAQIAELQNQNGNTAENSQVAIDNNSNSVASTPAHTENSQQGHAGTYEVTDVNGKKWTFVLNPDETVVVEDGGNTYYGTWGDYSSIDYNPRIEFPSDDYPRLQFPKTETVSDSFLAIDIENGFIYGHSADSSTYKSKNPKKRLTIKKIK